MKIVNKAHLLKLIFAHACAFLLISSLLVGLVIISHDKREIIAMIVNPGIFDKNIFQVSLLISLIIFSFTTISLCISIVRVLNHEYILLYDEFVEGPTESGERIVLSRAQLKYVGLNLLGQFSFQSNEGAIILPGKAGLSLAREIRRKVNSFFNTRISCLLYTSPSPRDPT